MVNAKAVVMVRYINILILIYSSLFAQMPELDSLTWWAVKNNTMANIWPGEECGKTQVNVLVAWSSGAYDPNNHRMFIWGGGHDDYYGNELYQFSIDSMKWSIAETQSTGYLNCGGSCIQTLADGKPNSRHTYDGLTYLIDRDKFMMVGGGPACLTGGCTGDSWWWDETDGWVQKTTTTIHYGCGKSAVYNPKDSCVYMQDYNGFYKYNPSTNSWFGIGGSSGDGLGGVCGAIDTVRNWYVGVGLGECYYYDLDEQPSCTKYNLSTSGGSTIIGTQAPGVEYDPVADKIVCYADGVIWVLDLDTNTWSSHTLAGAPPNTGGAAYESKIFGHFAYMSDYNAYVFIGGGVSDSVWVFKYKLAAGEWLARSRESSVVMAFDFDDSVKTRDQLHRSTAHQNWDLSTWVSDIKADGEGSLRMMIPADQNYGGTNDWKLNFSYDVDGDSMPDPARKFKGFNGPGGVGSDLGTTFWVQFQQRFDSTMLDNFWLLSSGRGGWKQCLTGNGDNYPWVWNHESGPPSEVGSATWNELCLNNAERRVAPSAYHGNPAFFSIVVDYNSSSAPNYTDTTNSDIHKGHTTDHKFQNVIDAGSQSHIFRQYALRQAYRDTVGEYGATINYRYYTKPPPTDYPSVLYHPNEWMTFMIKVTLGPLGTATSSIGGSGRTGWTNSTFTYWVAREKEEFVKIVEITGIVMERLAGTDTTTSDEGYGKIWLTVFHTGLDADAEGRADAYVWYDNLIVSSDSIATPFYYGSGQTAGGNGGTPSTGMIMGGTGKNVPGGAGKVY